MSALRDVSNWREVIEGILAPHKKDDRALSKVVARRILADITHYRHRGNHENDDIEMLANAMLAYHDLMNDERPSSQGG